LLCSRRDDDDLMRGAAAERLFVTRRAKKSIPGTVEARSGWSTDEIVQKNPARWFPHLMLFSRLPFAFEIVTARPNASAEMGRLLSLAELGILDSPMASA
jgi:hypothetical protein